MKHLLKALSALMLCLIFGAPALAQVTVEGVVTYGQTITQYAVAGGTVDAVEIQTGSLVHVRDTAATLTPTRVYAPCDGTVEAIFARAGESATNATAQYGGALSLAPENRYMIYASSEYAYESLRTTHIRVGQIVYLRCTADGSHRGTGVITQIDGDIFYIEATGGVFYNGETVYVYREADYESADRLGKATVVARTGDMVAADGEVSKLYVDVGDFVEKGQLLFEVLDALPDDPDVPALTLTVEGEGYVTSIYTEANAIIEKGAPLLSLCPSDGLVVSVEIPEADIASVHIGDECQLRIECLEDVLTLPGVVQSVSCLPTTDENDGVFYEARIGFDPDPDIAPGQTAVVRFI